MEYRTEYSWDEYLFDIKEEKADWASEAACRGQMPDIFYANDKESESDAKAICGTCPVRAECLEYATILPENHGIWGGATEPERRNLRRRMRQARTANYRTVGQTIVSEYIREKTTKKKAVAS